MGSRKDFWKETGKYSEWNVPYSQSSGPLTELLSALDKKRHLEAAEVSKQRHGVYAAPEQWDWGGSCDALTACWIVASAGWGGEKAESLSITTKNTGQSPSAKLGFFWQWLAPGGEVSVSAVDCIVRLQEEGKIRRTANHGYFKERGLIIENEGEITAINRERDGTKHVFDILSAKIGECWKKIHDNRPRYLYYTMGISGDRKGHAVGAIVRGPSPEVNFYDPNLGEIGFSSLPNFDGWIHNVFLKYWTVYIKYNGRIDWAWFKLK